MQLQGVRQRGVESVVLALGEQVEHFDYRLEQNKKKVLNEQATPTIRTQAGQGTAAQQLERYLLGDTTPARDWNTPLPQERQRSLEELISHYGGISKLSNASEDTAASSGMAAPTPCPQKKQQTPRRSRPKITGHKQWGKLINRYGGIKPLAKHLGFTPTTVRNWLNGRAQPHPANMAALEAADRHYRIATTLTPATPEQETTQAEQTTLPVTEQPLSLFGQEQWFLKVSGTIRVNNGQGSSLTHAA